MIHLLRHEAVFERQSLLIERAAPHAEALLTAIRARFERSRLPGALAALESVSVGSWLSPCRQFVILTFDRCPDVRCYIGVRPAGAHLEVLRVIAVEPGVIKRRLAALCCAGGWWQWSLPWGLSGDEELRTFLTIAASSVEESARVLAARLAGRVSPLDDERRDVLDEWPQ